MLRNSGCRLSAALAAGFVMFCSSVRAGEPGPYDGYKIARVTVTTQAELETLERHVGTIMNCVPGVGPMEVVASPRQLAEIRRLGMPVIILHEDVQALIDAGAPGGLRDDPFDDYFLDYHDYDGEGGIVWYMNELVSRYPDLASMVDVGTTLEGRTIWGLRITNEPTAEKPGVVYFGCEHAREWITTTVPPYVATHLLENYGTDPAVTDLVDNIDFFLIPVFNVDGYVFTITDNRMWRKNRRDNGDGTIGVDLNRNWAEGWGGEGSSGNTGSEIYRGPEPFSEPETQALRDFFIAHPNVRAQLDIHSYTQLILWPWGYTPALPPDQAVYFDVGSAMQSLIYGVHGLNYSIGPVYTAIYPASGVSLDWTYAQLDILSLSFECRDEGEYGFLLPPEQIIPQNEELLPAILHLTSSDWVRLPIRFAFPDGLPDYLLTDEETAITIEIAAQLEEVVPGSPRMDYRFDAGDPFASVLLEPQGEEFYTATLPGGTCGTTAEFYFYAMGDGGYEALSPPDAPADVYSAGITEVNEIFSDDMETDTGWTVSGDVSAGTWERGIPVDCNRGDPPSDSDGSGQCYLTDNSAVNCNSDVDDGYTFLTSPAIDLGSGDAQIQYALWYTNNNGSNPNNDLFNVYVSNDDGANWTLVETIGPVSAAGWTVHAFMVGDFVSPTDQVRVRFEASDLGGGSVVEAGVDAFDVTMFGCGTCPLPGDMNGDGAVRGDDIHLFVAAMIADPFYAACADMAEPYGAPLDMADLTAFVDRLLEP